MTKWVGLTEAIIATSQRKFILSEEDSKGVRHMITHNLIAPKSIGNNAAVFKSGVIPKELHKGRWEVLD